MNSEIVVSDSPNYYVFSIESPSYVHHMSEPSANKIPKRRNHLTIPSVSHLINVPDNSMLIYAIGDCRDSENEYHYQRMLLNNSVTSNSPDVKRLRIRTSKNSVSAENFQQDNSKCNDNSEIHHDSSCKGKVSEYVDENVPSCSTQSSEEVEHVSKWSKWKASADSTQKDLVKLRNKLRQKKSRAKKGNFKIVNRSEQSKLRKRESNRKYMAKCRLDNTKTAIERKKEYVKLKSKRLFHDNFTNDYDNLSLSCSETDRTYLSGKYRLYQESLKKYNAHDCSSLFAKKVESMKWNICLQCKTKYLGTRLKCYCSKGDIYLSSKLMHLGSVPSELTCLSVIEQLLIAKVHPVVQVYRLRGGQLGYSGHVINFFQDVKSFVKVLPHSISDVSNIVKVCCKTKTFHKDFAVRKKAVLEALQWLKCHNSLYFDVEIDASVLSDLPDDFQLNVMDDADIPDVEQSYNKYNTDEGYPSDISSSGIPQSPNFSPELKLKHNLKWPEIDPNPISESSKEKYIAQAFPTLFPYGIGDLNDVVNEKISARDYFQFLMNYHDGRFASHNIFPYFAWNSVMRWECMTKGTVYMRKHPEFKKVNLDLLKELMKTSPNIGKDVMVYSSNIRSTRNFWHTRCGELQEMVQQLDLPTIFFTLSAADFHWPKLYDLLKEMHNLENLSETERHQLLFNNPKVCSDYFYEVAEIFINDIMLVYFNVKDHWYRYEWQLRGSPHVHGVLWITGAVNVHELQQKFDQVKDKVIEYFDKLISCNNPDTNHVLTPDHPCRTRIGDVLDLGEDLAALVNTVQRHTQCNTKTCLKVDKHGILKCKHHFPKTLRDKSEIVLSERKYFEFEGSRNDDRLNKFNEFTLQNWRANHDFTAVLSAGGFTHYIAKYASKSEVHSNVFHDVFLKIVEKAPSKSSVQSAVQRTLMSSLVERDYSAQEVHHLLAGHKLYSCSRSFVNLNLNITDWFFHLNLNSCSTDNFQDNCNAIFNSYSQRPSNMRKVCLLDYVKFFNTKTHKRKRGRCNIVRVYPKADLTNCTSTCIEPIVSRQLCILFCPWRSISDLPSNDEGWTNMRINHKLKITSLPYYKESSVTESVSVSDSEDDGEDLLERKQEDWMKLLHTEDVIPEISDLGCREIDLCYDWKSNVTTIDEQIKYQSFVKNHKEGFVKVVPLLPKDIVFTSEQNEILGFVDGLVESLKVNGNFGDLEKFMVCQANAGCGKTITIQGIVHLISQKYADDSILLIAPTAAAAVNAGGRTIHSALHVSIRKYLKNIDLSGETLHKFQQQYLNIRFVIIEEFSMVGCRLLSLINRRCMQMRNSTELFGGCAVMLFGDIKQLPPVGDISVCRSDMSKVPLTAKEGYNLFHCVENVKVLKKCHRQSESVFCNLLEHISHGICTEEDKTYLLKRFEENVEEVERDSFADAIHLFMKRKGVHDFNEMVLKAMNVPVIKINADNNSTLAAACSEELASNLMPILYLGVGVRVMLKANIWTDAGLVNGAFGTVKAILYNSSNTTSVPDYIMVKFDDYTGPVVHSGCVPIPRILRSWDLNGQHCTRLQFPLDLAYATTYHKSQGLTIPKCVVHIDEKENSPGMYYVALSRVRKAADILIVGDTSQCPIFSINKKLYEDRIISENWLMSKAIGTQ